MRQEISNVLESNDLCFKITLFIAAANLKPLINLNND